MADKRQDNPKLLPRRDAVSVFTPRVKIQQAESRAASRPPIRKQIKDPSACRPELIE